MSVRPAALLAALLLTVGTAGCVSQATLASDHAALKRTLADAQARTRCAPRDLALAEANLAFAELEFEEGDTRRASQHLALGQTHARVAAECAAAAVRPPTPEDSDGDGIADRDDLCVSEAEDLDAFKDADGCPDPDNDLDGIGDAADGCPVAPEDLDGFADADGCPDPDNDADGLADAQDACPNEAGAAVDMGCPVRDRDGDGVNDDVDRCPDQAEVLNAYLDDDGCPDVKPQRVEITSEQIVIKQRINFATGKATILADSFPVLDDVAQVMRDYPAIKVEIGGHTDSVGDDASNQRLSKARADAVFEYLLDKAVPAQRMITIGYGETRPIDTNRTEDGRLNNRRVEFMIIEEPATRSPEAPPR